MKPVGLDRVFDALMMKTCTHCNETVRAEARRCQFCNVRFDVTAATWPAKLNLAAAIALGGGTALAATGSLLHAAPALAIACVLLVVAAVGRRTTRKKLFARTGPLPALRKRAHAA